jgi:hypothetical protein
MPTIAPLGVAELGIEIICPRLVTGIPPLVLILRVQHRARGALEIITDTALAAHLIQLVQVEK